MITEAVLRLLQGHYDLIEDNNFDKLYDLLTPHEHPNLTLVLQLAEIDPLPYLTIVPEEFARALPIKEVTIPARVKAIEMAAFYECHDLAKVTLEGGQLKALEQLAFRGCTSLKKIIIPHGVERLNYQSFMNCTSLEKIRLPQSLRQIAGEVFEGCKQLTKIDYMGTIAQWWKIDILYNQHLHSCEIHCSDGDLVM